MTVRYPVKSKIAQRTLCVYQLLISIEYEIIQAVRYPVNTTNVV